MHSSLAENDDKNDFMQIKACQQWVKAIFNGKSKWLGKIVLADNIKDNMQFFKNLKNNKKQRSNIGK